MVRFLGIVLLGSALIPLSRGGEEIKDETRRRELLRMAFPGSTVSPAAGAIDWSSGDWKGAGVPDGLRGEREYQVVGPVGDGEEPWARDVRRRRNTDVRRLRLKVFRPAGIRRDSTYVLVTQYTFPNASHPMCCVFMGRVYLLSFDGRGWRISHTAGSLIDRGRGIGSVFLDDLNGDAIDEVGVEAEGSRTGGEGWARWMNLTIFDVSSFPLHELVSVQTAYEDEAGNLSRLILDATSTRLTRAANFVFLQRTYVRSGRPLSIAETKSVIFSAARRP